MQKLQLHYFNLEEDSRKGDPVSAYLFSLCLEVLLLLVKAKLKYELTYTQPMQMILLSF